MKLLTLNDADNMMVIVIRCVWLLSFIYLFFLISHVKKLRLRACRWLVKGHLEN